jgi:hypothetical protein
MPTRRQRRGGFSFNPMNWLSDEKKNENGAQLNASPVSNVAASNSVPYSVPSGGRRSRRRSRRSRIRKRR